MTPSTGAYESQDERGQATIRVCGLNRAECAQGRSDAWMALTVLISTYADWKFRRRDADAERVLRVIDKYPFQSVRLHMVRVFEEAADPTLLLSLEVIEAFGRFAELLGRGAVEEDAAE